MITKSNYGKAVVEGLQDVKRYVEAEYSKPEAAAGEPSRPLADRSVNETVRGEIDGLIKKHADAKPFPRM